jgi:hypothetical protein
VEASGEVLGGGGRGARRWRGGARCRRKRHSPVERCRAEEFGARGRVAWGRPGERCGSARCWAAWGQSNEWRGGA